MTELEHDVRSAVGDATRLQALRDLRLLDTLPEEAFDRLTRLASELLGVPVALTSLVDADRQFFKSCLGLPEPWATQRETPLSHSFCQHVVASREPLVVSDAREVPYLMENLAIRDLGVIAYAGYPLFGPNGEALGSFCAIDDKPRDWSEHDLAVLSDLAAFAQAEIDLRSAGIAAARAAHTLERLQALSDAALSTVELDALLQRVVTDATRVFTADAAVVDLLDEEGRLRRRASVGLRVDEDEPTLALGRGFAGRVAQRRSPMRTDNAEEFDDLRPSMRHGGMRSLLGAPLRARGELLGTVVLGARRHGAWTAEDELLIGLAAERLALAITNARMYAREQRVAVQLQQALSPEIRRSVHGVRVAARYRAAERDVGGDWYDAFPLGGDRIGVAIGDVVGHGVAAAAVAVRARHHLRGFALEGHDAPGAVALLDRIAEHDPELRWSTVLYAEFDARTGDVVWASAGHLPPILARPGVARPLDVPGGTPLGVVSHEPWPHGTARLDPGDRLLLYTDGLVERRRSTIDAGIAGICRAAEHPSELDPLCDALIARADGVDDTALIVVEAPGT